MCRRLQWRISLSRDWRNERVQRNHSAHTNRSHNVIMGISPKEFPGAIFSHYFHRLQMTLADSAAHQSTTLFGCAFLCWFNNQGTCCTFKWSPANASPCFTPLDDALNRLIYINDADERPFKPHSYLYISTGIGSFTLPSIAWCT